MENPANPYATPSANLYGSAAGAGSEAVAPSTIAQLSGTKAWVRFMSVLIWIGAVLMILGAVFILLAGSTGLKAAGASNAYNAGMMVGMAAYYGVLSFVMIYPALKLGKYANCIGRLIASHSVADLDAALTEQRRYWKFSGILVIVAMCLAAAGFVAILAFGLTAMKAGGLPS